MRKTRTVTLALIVLLVTTICFPAFTFQSFAQVSSVAWDNRYSKTIDYRNGTYTTSTFIGPQVFWDNETESWQELKFEYDVAKKYYLLQNSHMSLHVYEDKPSSYFDPDNQRLCVEKEVVTVEYDNKGKWQIVDLKNPVLTVDKNSSSEIRLTKTFSGKDGILSITYSLKPASRLKHDFVFKSYFADKKTFRVHFKLEGVPSLKVKSAVGAETLSGIKSVGKVPYLMFGEDNDNLVLTEYLWSLGVSNETTGEWNPTTLQDVVLDVEAGKGKADIIIGNYTLSENESLLIDPDSDTFYVGGSYDDAHESGNGSFQLTDAFLYVNARTNPLSEFYQCGGFRFPSATIPQEATISATNFLGYTSTYYEINCIIYGNDVDNAQDFNDLNKIISTVDRPRTSASVSWVETLSHEDWQEKTGLESIVQEIINREGWNSGNAIVLLFIANTDSTKTCRFLSYDQSSSYAAYLEVTWETAAGEEYERTGSQSVAVAPSSSKLFEAVRGATQGLSTATATSRLIEVTRSVNQALGLSPVTTKLSEFAREVTQGIAISLAATRIQELVTGATQSIASSLSGDRLAEIAKGVSQATEVSSVGSRLIEITKDATQGITVSLTSSKFLSFVRAATQEIDVSLTGSKISDFVRAATQTITLALQSVATFTSGIAEYFRTASLSITASVEAIGEMIPGISEYFRTATLSITVNIQGVGKTFHEYFRSVTLAISAALNSLRSIEILPPPPPPIMPPGRYEPIVFDMFVSTSDYIVLPFSSSVKATIDVYNRVGIDAEVMFVWTIIDSNNLQVKNGSFLHLILGYQSKTLEIEVTAPTEEGDYILQVDVPAIDVTGSTTYPFHVYGITTWLLGPGIFMLAMVTTAVIVMLYVKRRFRVKPKRERGGVRWNK